MPKLNKATAKKAAAAESANRDLVPEGIYVVELKKVEAKTGKQSGNPYWSWTFEIPDTEDEYAGKRFWVNTSLQENAMWKLKEVFDAFGEDPDTDTDDLVGEQVRLVVTQAPIGAGARAGEMSNQAETVLPLEPGDDDGDGDGAAASGDDEPPF